MNMSHIVKATELKLFAKFHDDWSKQSVSNATSPNYANYEVRFNMPEVLEISIRPIRVANSFGLEKNPPKTFETTKFLLRYPNR